MSTEAQFTERLADFRQKAVLLRQIHSDKMHTYATLDAILNYGTLLAAAFATFLGFFGVEKAVETVTGWQLSPQSIGLSYNMIVFALLILSITTTASSLKSKEFIRWRSIIKLTEFITEIDDMRSQEIRADSFGGHLLDLSKRYRSLIEFLPPNNDRQYISAKKHINNKKKNV